MYGATIIGDVVNGTLTSDDGITFVVREQQCEGDLSGTKRAMVLADILSKAVGKDTYDIRLLSFSNVLVKDMVVLSETDPGTVEEMGSDPINPQSIWQSGKYLNIIFTIPYSDKTSVPHRINLVYEGDEDGKMVFTLRHNAFGEVYDQDHPVGVTSFGNGVASFPLTLLLGRGTPSVQIEVRSEWYEKKGDILGYETVPVTVQGTVVLQGK